MKLTREKHEQARTFLFEQGRPLEQALYAFHFGGGPADAGLDALAKFQNADGGFGHALEPDLRAPVSTAIATTVGLQVLREVGADQNCPLVRSAVGYLLDTYDAQRRVWPIIIPEVNDWPHAPWWHYAEDFPSRWGGYLVNPRAEVVGYLIDYAALVPADLPVLLLEEVVEYLKGPKESLEMHELLCCARLLWTASLPASARQRLMRSVCPAAEAMVGRGPEEWAGYGLKPIHVAPSPESPLAERLGEVIRRNLEFEIERQGPDGAWAPNWSWPGEAWRDAERDAKGLLTLRTLLALRNYDRLE
jgi:hypothetical protein